jgi:hypothetical protein
MLPKLTKGFGGRTLALLTRRSACRHIRHLVVSEDQRVFNGPTASGRWRPFNIVYESVELFLFFLVNQLSSVCMPALQTLH